MGAFSGPGYQKWFMSMIAKHRSEGIARYFDFIMPVDVTEHLAHIKVPTLVVSPRNSMASPVAVNENIAAQIKESRMVVIESIGHMAYIDQPQATCDAILQWVRDIAAKA